MLSGFHHLSHLGLKRKYVQFKYFFGRKDLFGHLGEGELARVGNRAEIGRHRFLANTYIALLR